MRPIWRIFLFILKLMNWWLLVIPSRFSFLAMVGNFLIIYWFQDGRPLYLLERELRGKSDILYLAFLVAFCWPMFYGFICCWSGAKMASAGFRKNGNYALDRAIDYRNGQIGVQTPQEAFKTLRDTASLDQMKANEGNDAFDKAVQGFGAMYSNKPPQAVFKALTD